ncbi:MAG TPA: Omp28-related outer membrane protein, partial [Bacteroidia bacterium]|nr:Omp28-related outer membrane protein [Bacteroidia bacterium]
MKKLYTLAGAALLSTTISAQSSFFDDFESYTVGQYIGAVSPAWTTWSGTTGGTEDTQVNNTMNNTTGGSNSVRYSSTSATGGPQDCVLPFGGQYNTGTFNYAMDMFVTPSQGAYFNFQANTTVGQVWAMEAYMPQTGDLILSNTNGQLLTSTYPLNQWFTIEFNINLNSNVWELRINNALIGSFPNTINQIASVDIFPVNASYSGNNNSEFYVDNVSYSYTPYTLPVLNAAVTQIGGVNPGLATQVKNPVVTVRNLGTTAITSFNLALNYNSGTINLPVTSVNVASLATYTVTMAPVTLAAGSMPLSVTVSNVNGNASDGDPSDDVKTITLNPVVPVPNKIVVGEEGTGTWCPWCVRGTVYMDYMENNYDGFWAGIAVHNGDPMADSLYDIELAPLIGFAYPNMLVDRDPNNIDPSAVEAAFMSQIVVPINATISNTAQYNATTRVLDVTITYNFTAAATSAWKVICVITEDAVTGIGATYSQANAYAGGANGPMGGFENLPSPVPYTQMVYDHVARFISPSFQGGTGFPATVSPGYTQSFNYSFTLDPSWNVNDMHIIGMLVDPSGVINNASYTTANEAMIGVAEPAPAGPLVNIFPNPT